MKKIIAIIVVLIILIGGYIFSTNNNTLVNESNTGLLDTKEAIIHVQRSSGDFSVSGLWKTVDYTTNTKWVIDYTGAKYYETSDVRGSDSSIRPGNFEQWLKEQKAITIPHDGPDIPGATEITGIVGPDGVLHASKILQHVQ